MALGLPVGPTIAEAEGSHPCASGQPQLVVVDLVAVPSGAEGAGIHGEVETAPEPEAVIVQPLADAAVVPPEISPDPVGHGPGARIEQPADGSGRHPRTLRQEPAFGAIIEKRQRVAFSQNQGGRGQNRDRKGQRKGQRKESRGSGIEHREFLRIISSNRDAS